MRLLFISNYYPPFSLGGYELWCQEVAEALAGRGHKVTVLTSQKPKANQGESQNGVDVRRWLHLEAEPGFWATALRFFLHRKRHAQQNARVVGQTIAELRPDAALLWGMWNVPRSAPALVETLLPDRVAYYLCDYWLTLPSAFAQYWQTPSGRRITRTSKQLLARVALAQLGQETVSPLELTHSICVSRGLRDQLVRSGIPLQDATVIYGGISIEEFAVAPAAQGAGAASADSYLRLLFAGRVTPDKGVHTVLAALGRLNENHRKHVTLDIVGRADPTYRRQLEAEIKRSELGQQVRFHDGAPRNAMPGIMTHYDVLVFPSVWPEPFARIPLEALASGLAVIGTTTGGTGEVLIHGETGLTFAPSDPEALSAQIKRLVDDPGLCTRLAIQGQKAVREHFTLRRMVDEIEAYLAKMIEQACSRP